VSSTAQAPSVAERLREVGRVEVEPGRWAWPDDLGYTVSEEEAFDAAFPDEPWPGLDASANGVPECPAATTATTVPPEPTAEEVPAPEATVEREPVAKGRSPISSGAPATGQESGEAESFRLEPLDWDRVRAHGVPTLEYLLEPYVPARKRIWGVGAAESGKSIWAAFKSAELTRAGLVVCYVSQENGLDEETRRFLRLEPRFDLLRLYVDQGLDLTRPDHIQALLEVSTGAALTVLDTLTACWSGDEDSNGALAAFDRDVLKPLVNEIGAAALVLDHTGNPQQFVRRRGVNAPRGASSKGQKTDWLLEFQACGACEFKIHHGKGRGGGLTQPTRTFRVVDVDVDGPDGPLLDIVEIESSAEEKVVECADVAVEKVVEAGEMITKALRAALKALGYSSDTASSALGLLEGEDPPRLRVAWGTIETGGGRQRAKVWRPADAPISGDEATLLDDEPDEVEA
jgi:hypothetical protein